IISHSDFLDRERTLTKISNYNHEIGYSPKNKRMRKAPLK
ncbi:unnamed protein product, partial [Brassica rapa subsp. trilocularis]